MTMCTAVIYIQKYIDLKHSPLGTKLAKLILLVIKIFIYQDSQICGQNIKVLPALELPIMIEKMLYMNM